LRLKVSLVSECCGGVRHWYNSDTCNISNVVYLGIEFQINFIFLKYKRCLCVSTVVGVCVGVL
jgi:hypothetical protein